MTAPDLTFTIMYLSVISPKLSDTITEPPAAHLRLTEKETERGGGGGEEGGI